ncbi:hypothetical protein [Actinoplanes sp. NPDC049681]|uniref:hypothetical protein n=1 Tax=Actinoplanes sp. NPDC049681 TaxID=3363905 RepID=UPI0037A2B80C
MLEPVTATATIKLGFIVVRMVKRTADRRLLNFRIGAIETALGHVEERLDQEALLDVQVGFGHLATALSATQRAVRDDALALARGCFARLTVRSAGPDEHRALDRSALMFPESLLQAVREHAPQRDRAVPGQPGGGPQGPVDEGPPRWWLARSRPPREPRRFRLAIWSLGSGIVARTCLSRRACRFAREQYALSVAVTTGCAPARRGRDARRRRWNRSSDSSWPTTAWGCG